MKKTDKGNVNLNIGEKRKLILGKYADQQEKSMTSVVQDLIDKIQLKGMGRP